MLLIINPFGCFFLKTPHSDTEIPESKYFIKNPEPDERLRRSFVLWLCE